MLNQSRTRPDAAPEPAVQRADALPKRSPRRSAARGEVRDRALEAATDAAVDAMASWGFVWVRDPCGCDGTGHAWIKDATLETGGQLKKCICAGQGRVWYPQGRRTSVRVTDRQLLKLYAREQARRAIG
jgi:hypothetical protein